MSTAQPSPEFVHLRLHSEFSITDGLTRIDEAIAQAAADGQPALAITDLANLFAMVKFYTAARAAGVKPVIGCDVWIGEEGADRNDAPARLLLLAKNRAGYLRLCELLSAAYLAPRRHGRAEIGRGQLGQGDNSGLIALSGGPSGDIAQLLAAGKLDQADVRAQAWARLFPGAYYVEVQRPGGRNGPAADEVLVAASADLAARLGLPLVATHPVQFISRDDAKAHEARVCIAEGYVLGDKRRPQRFSAEQYFKTRAEMAELFADLPEALQNSVEIARRCNLTVELGKSRLPDFPTPAGEPLEAFLASESHAGLARRLELLYPDAAERESRRPQYAERLDFEIATIVKMGFPGYFLIVADFINWAKHNGVPVGPGRGSGAGSLVAYSLGITDLDPLRYDLLFERFLNPERVSMPDFDIDFCQEGRDRVIDYVKNKYGAHAVSQIATFGTMAAKAVIRDVGRVLDLGFNFVDQFAKLIPNELGITLKDALEKEPHPPSALTRGGGRRTVEPGAEARRPDPQRRHACRRGADRTGQTDRFLPAVFAGRRESAVSQFDKDDVEKAGLVKFDFLGLRTLTILAEAVRFARRKSRTVDLDLDDPAARRQADLRQGLQDGQHHGGVPVRIARHEGCPGARPSPTGSRTSSP
jgi:DNA polymerase-3 subunit alpha